MPDDLSVGDIELEAACKVVRERTGVVVILADTVGAFAVEVELEIGGLAEARYCRESK